MAFALASLTMVGSRVGGVRYGRRIFAKGGRLQEGSATAAARPAGRKVDR
jgi:hypothetical protein